jgi:pilus assembly protein CpaF
MALMSDVDLPLVHLREQIASAVDVIVHMSRPPDGRRVAWQVSSVDGLHEGRPVVNEIFAYRREIGPEGAFEATGAIPKVVGVLRDRGEDVADEWFASHGRVIDHARVVSAG